MSIETKVTSESKLFEYVVPNGDIDGFSAFDGWNLLAIANMLFHGAIMSPSQTRHSPLDTWGNVKIHHIEQYESVLEPDHEGWYNTSLDGNDMGAYISFVGIPFLSKVTRPIQRRLITTCVSRHH